MTDRVQLPRLYLAWLTPRMLAVATPRSTWCRRSCQAARTRAFTSGLSTTCRSRRASKPRQSSQALAPFLSSKHAEARAHNRRAAKVIDEEIAKLQGEGPTEREVQRALNQIESSFFDRMERVGGFGGKADQLNAYYTNTRSRLVQRRPARYRSLAVSTFKRPPMRLPRGAASS